ncbi:MAG: GxxExxY protein [Acidobacteriia bacterium]|nr:GxxExxY protein [Terriglobia bacterium]
MKSLPQRTQSTAESKGINTVTHGIIGAAMKVHSALGPGLLESAYEACLMHELRKAGFEVKSQVELPVIYDGVHIDLGYRLDLLVNDSVVVELKCVEKISPVHEAQIISYLKLSGKRVGLIINFHVRHLKDGIRRFIEGPE